MRKFIILVRKEFRQLVRDKFLLRITLLLPIIQLLILPLAANYEIKNFNMAIIDRDGTTLSMRLVTKIQASGYFTMVGRATSWDEAQQMLDSDRADIIIEIPHHFERDMVLGRSPELPIHVSAINGLSAGVGAGYLGSIVSDYVAMLTSEKQVPAPAPQQVVPQIEVATQAWFNPRFDYKIVIVPGILAMLITIIGVALSALNIVKEKESGTIEQINVTPLSRSLFMLSKMAPVFIIGMFQLAVGLVLAYYVYNVPVEGSLWLLLAFAVIYLVGMLGLGFTIANVSNSQIQVMFTIFFFLMIMILMSGLFTPVESMPQWAQSFNLWNPVAHMIAVVKMVLIKGSTAADLGIHWLCLSIFTVVTSCASVLTFRKLHS